MADVGKCDVKGCSQPAAHASVALLPEGGAVPVVVCKEHLAEGEGNYTRLYGAKKKKVRRGGNN